MEPADLGDQRPLEYIPEESTYTRDEIAVEVTYVSKGGFFGLPAEMCVMSIRELKQDD